MALNVVWVGLFVVAFVTGLLRLCFGSTEADATVFDAMVASTFEMAKTGFEIALGLTGVLTLWLGLMRLGERGGVIEGLAFVVRPLFARLFPELPRDHPVHGAMVLNFAANMLGLDNAATPLGLRAMRELQDLNPSPTHASNAQIMFLVLNTSGLTLIPIAVMTYRAQQGAANPTDVFVPILLTTFFSTLAGLIAVSLVQRIQLWRPVVLVYLATMSAAIAGILWFFTSLPGERVEPISRTIANVTLFSVIMLFILAALWRRVQVFETFIEGAVEGFQTAIKIVPYLVGLLVAIGVFRASGAMDWIVGGIGSMLAGLGLQDGTIDALPTALMKPLSGGGSRALMIDTMQTHGADSFAGRLASVFQGATDTTFYIIAVYFGSVAIRNTRHAVACGLIADLTAIVAGIVIAHIFFA